MIEFIENKETKNPKNKFQLIIDEQIISAKVRNFVRDGKIFRNINVIDLESARIISNYKFKDFPNLYYLTLPIKFAKTKYFERIYVTYNKSTGQYEIKFRYSANLSIWKNRANYLRFYTNYSRYIAELNYPNSELAYSLKERNLNPRLESLSHKSFGFEVLFVVFEFNDNLIDEINKYSKILAFYHNEVLKFAEAENTIQEENRAFRTIINIFNFPEELKISCEQYLLYFAQFLQDLGINATSNLKEEAGKVLFSVTPTDDTEALDKIYEALAVYLNLPNSPITEIEYSENFAMMRLQQQVRNLQHSLQMRQTELLSTQYALRLAQQNIENQDQLNTRQNNLIENQSKIIEKIMSKSIMIDSAENKEELEEIYEGIKVGESKWLKELTGIGLNPAKAIKEAVKNTFGKDDKKSVLGLDKEE